MQIELEDFFEDVLGKSLRGIEMSDATLAEASGVEMKTIASLKEGKLDEAALRAVAPVLKLAPESLVELAMRSWQPEAVELDGLRQFSTDFEGVMLVNAYLIWDPQTLEAAFFDTGADAQEALAAVDELGLNLKTLFITHSHFDHVKAMPEVVAKVPNIRVLVNGSEPVAGAEQFETGDSFKIGNLSVSTRLTRGHSPAGTTFVVNGLSQPVGVVGDALFAQSMGGTAISYTDALATNRSEIFTLPDETVLCPGHGPMTSVGEEKRHNPFFPEFKKS